MLSFDVTDRKIRIIKGTETNGKIKISAAAEIALEESVIVNGHVNDTNRVAVMINQVLKRNNMPDKEAIVAISSNQTVFKELLITPNPKEAEFMKEIRQQLQVQINVDDSYSVAYVIVGEPEEDEVGDKKQRVLVTALEYEVVECYKRIFHMLGIALKSVMIGCNAITKVLMADSKIMAKMPLLAVQIDSDFISLNLYEDNQLSFSRFASIDPEDYDNPDDYVFEAVNENVFRMLQFARSRGSDSIENVVVYGDLNVSDQLYERLVDELSQNELNVSQLTVPPQIHGYQNLEFAMYANAIGAMFKRNKLTEHINLLETEGNNGGGGGRVKSDQSFPIYAGIGLGVSLLCVVGAFAVLSVMDSNVKSDTRELRNFLDSPDTASQLQLYDALQIKKDDVIAYKTAIDTASEAYKTQPVVTREYYDAIDAAVEAVQAANETTPQPAVVQEFEYAAGEFRVPIQIETTSEGIQTYPGDLVEYIYDNYSDLFERVYYTGYEVTANVNATDAAGPTTSFVSFTLLLRVDWNEAMNLELETVAEEEAAVSEEAAQ